MALAFPVFRMERFAVVIPTFLANSVLSIFRLASITSRFTIIGMVQTVSSFSSFKTFASWKIYPNMRKNNPMINKKKNECGLIGSIFILNEFLNRKVYP